jgi:hypothetical protein
MTADADAFEGMLRDAASKLEARLPGRLRVTFRPLTEAYFRTTARGTELRVVVNDALDDAPLGVLAALAEVIVARASGAARPRDVGGAFWEHVEEEAFRGRMQRNYLARQRSFRSEPAGEVWDLVEVFDHVNSRYFGGSLDRPMLGWTLRPLTYRWGWYSSMVRPHGLIVINRLLDDPEVPRFLVEGTMHHEMLHMLSDARVVNGRRVVHTREFRRAERSFERYPELRPEYRRVLGRYARRLAGEGGLTRGRRRR